MLNRALPFVTPWTAAHQAPLSMIFSRQGYWSGLPFPSPGDLPNPGIKPGSPALRADSLLTELQGKPCLIKVLTFSCCVTLTKFLNLSEGYFPLFFFFLFNNCYCLSFLKCISLFKKFTYLFLAAQSLRCCTQVFSSCGEQGLLTVVASPVMEQQGLLCRAHGLSSCPMACGIFLDQGSKLCPLHWQADS